MKTKKVSKESNKKLKVREFCLLAVLPKFFSFLSFFVAEEIFVNPLCVFNKQTEGLNFSLKSEKFSIGSLI